MMNLKRGMIVVVMDGVSFGNPEKTITKILAKPGITNDQNSRRYVPWNKNSILCENIDPLGSIDRTYLNKPCYYESIDDLRLATKFEKKLYSEGIIYKTSIGQIETVKECAIDN